MPVLEQDLLLQTVSLEYYFKLVIFEKQQTGKTLKPSRSYPCVRNIYICIGNLRLLDVFYLGEKDQISKIAFPPFSFLILY